MMNHKPRLLLDAYVLAQGVKTGIYRVCDELFGRLVRSDAFNAEFFLRAGYEDRGHQYLAASGISVATLTAGDAGPFDIVLSPFGVAPASWIENDLCIRAHLIYDLIGIHRPDFFSEVAAQEVRDIMAQLDEETVIFTISEFTKQQLLDYRSDLSPAQITVIPLAAGAQFYRCGSEAQRTQMRAKYAIPPAVPYVLSLATLEIRKNLDQVVRAFVKYLDEHAQSDLHLVLAGMSGWMLDRLNAALDSASRWRHRIVLTGFVDDGDLAALYSDALCFAYLSKYEGFGLPPLEAMACGTPVICSSNSSLPEVVGEAGILVDADDASQAADAISSIVESATLREQLADAGLQRARLFSWDRCADLVTDSLLRARSRRRRAVLPVPQRVPPVPRWQLLRDSRLLDLASLAGFRSGAVGPAFGQMDRACEGKVRAWPAWSDRVAATQGPSVSEGGLRVHGRLKHGTANLPLVSYVTIVRNGEATLARTIDSVLAQSYPNVEHVVLDGASTDGTLDLVLRYADRLDYFASRPDAGLYDALNKIVPLARGQLICVLNADDWLEPRAAEIAVHRMRGIDLNDAALLLSSALVEAGETLVDWRPAFVHPGSYLTCANVCHNAIYATRKAYEIAGPYDTSFSIAADFKWVMRCLDVGARFVYTHEWTANYSLGGTSGDVRQHSLECMRVVSERFPSLNEAEVSGLYHAFFQLAGPVAAQQEGRPDRFADFLWHLLARHAAERDLVEAVSWASMATLEHPRDREAAHCPIAGRQAEAVVAPVTSPSLRARIARRLRSHPRLHAVVRRAYLVLRG